MSTPTLHTYICQKVCKSVTAKAVYSGHYIRCGACRSWAVYKWSEPVTTDEQRAIHAKGTVVNPFPPKPVVWSCVRCGEDKTGTLPTHRADGKVCPGCHSAEPPQYRQTVDVAAIDRRRLELENREQ